jgi:glycosyltransferase involved in cell wall biosynthesis
MKSLKIGFDAKRILNNNTGLGVYGKSLVQNLINQFPQNEYFLFTPKQSLPQSDLFESAKIIQPNNALQFFWRQWGIGNEVQKQNLDIYHGLSNEIPFKRNPSTRYVCTIHDLIWIKLPQLYNPIDRFIYTQKLKYACKYADVLIATSQQTADDLMYEMKVPAKKIKVIYQTGPDVPQGINSEPPLAEPYFLYVSTFEERKNHLTLLKAFYAIKNRQQHKLVFAGKTGPTLTKIKQYIEKNGLQTEVKILENIAQADKFWWLKHAQAFVYPSIYEGFGIPLIEAMKVHTPIVASNIPVFKEIAGDDALYFDPTDVNALQNILESLINNPSQSVKPNADYLSKFSPKETSLSLMQVYNQLL